MGVTYLAISTEMQELGLEDLRCTHTAEAVAGIGYQRRTEPWRAILESVVVVMACTNAVVVVERRRRLDALAAELGAILPRTQTEIVHVLGIAGALACCMYARTRRSRVAGKGIIISSGAG